MKRVIKRPYIRHPGDMLTECKEARHRRWALDYFSTEQNFVIFDIEHLAKDRLNVAFYDSAFYYLSTNMPQLSQEELKSKAWETACNMRAYYHAVSGRSDAPKEWSFFGAEIRPDLPGRLLMSKEVQAGIENAEAAQCPE